MSPEALTVEARLSVWYSSCGRNFKRLFGAIGDLRVVLVGP